MKLMDNFSLVGELPGKGPWKVVTYRGVPVFVSAGHPPYMIMNGVLTPVDIGGEEHALSLMEYPDPLVPAAHKAGH